MIDEVNANERKQVDMIRSAFTCKNISKRLPILQWLPVYTSDDCVGDLLAGITVGLTLIPQSMSFAALAGLPPQVNTNLADSGFSDLYDYSLSNSLRPRKQI